MVSLHIKNYVVDITKHCDIGLNRYHEIIVRISDDE